MKGVTMAAAIDKGLVEPDTKPDDLPGGFKNMLTIDGYEIHNSTDTSYGFETMTQVLENSDNIGMVWVANKMGDEVMGQYLKDFGFGGKTGIDVESESQGNYEDPAHWRDVHRATISFGQGISVTPIQMVQAYSAIANKGKLVKPHLLDKVISPTGEQKQIQTTEVRQVIKEETAKKVTDMLVSVVEKGHGKAAKVEGYKVAGKTGTAQVANKDGKGYEEDAHIGGFIGFAPAEDPKFVMLVKLDRPTAVKFAESSAAPVFGEIAQWLLTNYYR
jgi:cell division protein FtsI/penicillin-binding protein 2